MSRDRTAAGRHVLVVTADSSYAEQAKYRLSADGECRVTTARSVGEALDSLATTPSIDCIVSDHDLPDTDGVAFLEAVRAQQPDLPFVLFTSDGSETVASRAISADVTEYLIREHHGDQWEQLAALIDEAVRYTQTRSDLIDPEKRARDILNATHDALAVVRDGQYEYLNDAAVSLLGVATRDAIIGTDVSETVPATEKFSTDHLTAIQQGDETVERSEARLTGRDGVSTPVEITATSIEWAGTPALILVIRDISERLERQQELAVKDRVLDGAPVGIAIASATREDTPVIYTNEQFEELTGYTEAECLGRNLRFLQGENTAAEPVAAMRAAIEADEPVTVEVRNYRKDGTEFWNRVTIAPIEDETGTVTQYVGFQEDVTERRENEQTRRRFQRAVEAAGNVIHITDTDGTIQYVNPAFEAVTGYSSEEALGENPRLLQSGKMSDAYYETLWDTVLGGEVWEDEIINRRKSGELYYAQETIAPLTDDDGEVTAFVAIQTDITEQREREEQLRQYERAIEGANDLICAIDAEYDYLFANQGYRDYHGLEQEDLAGIGLETVLKAETWATAKPYVDRALAGSTVQYRTTRSRDNRPDRTFDIRYYPLESDETGEVEGVVATLRDITPQRDREQQLDVLDRVLRHNLRNAMSVITGNAELIATETSGEISALAENIIGSSQELLGVTEREREIVEVLSEARFVRPLDLTTYVTRPVEQLRDRHPEADIRLSAPAEIRAAAIPQIEQAVRELIRNAIRHSDRDTPVIDVTVETHTDTVEITVADDGPGIPSHEQNILSRGGDIDPLYHGSGMGLWLINWIVTHSDGLLRFAENDPRGSTVTITLPRERATHDGPLHVDAEMLDDAENDGFTPAARHD